MLPRELTLCALQYAQSIFTCLPSLPYLSFPTNPLTPTPSQRAAAPPLPRGVRRGALCGGERGAL